MTKERMAFSFPRHDALWARIETEFHHGDLAHDADHVLRVYAWAIRLAPEAGADIDLAGAAALVHDLVNVPKDAPERPTASTLSADASLEHLRAVGYDADEVRTVYNAVRTCSWSRGLSPVNPVGTVLQDADRLDAIGAIGIARTFACAQSMSQPGNSAFFDPRDANGLSRPLDDRRFALDHFAAKLLKLAGGMHLDTAKREAAQRHAVMEAFVSELVREAEQLQSHRSEPTR